MTSSINYCQYFKTRDVDSTAGLTTPILNKITSSGNYALEPTNYIFKLEYTLWKRDEAKSWAFRQLKHAEYVKQKNTPRPGCSKHG